MKLICKENAFEFTSFLLYRGFSGDCGVEFDPLPIDVGGVFSFLNKELLLENVLIFHIAEIINNSPEYTDEVNQTHSPIDLSSLFYLDRSFLDDKNKFSLEMSVVIERFGGKVTFDYNQMTDFYIRSHLPNLKKNVYIWLSRFINQPNLSLFANNLTDKKHLYINVLSNGSVELLDKFSNVLFSFSYADQEHLVAHAIHFEPKNLFVYDELNLLKPELVVCLKKFLKGKVDFIDEKYPVSTSDNGS